jgi:hypothetical protein
MEAAFEICLISVMADTELRTYLEKHLCGLASWRAVRVLHEGQILPGEPEGARLAMIARADLVLVLVSAHFLASDRAMSDLVYARSLGKNIVVVALRPCVLEGEQLQDLRNRPT